MHYECLDDANVALTDPPSNRGPWWKLGRARCSDAEYIERLRKTVASLDRWKRWRWVLIVLYVSILGACIWFGFQFDAMLARFDDHAPLFANQHRGKIVLLGLVLGFKFGYILQGSLFALFGLITYDVRTARLLLEYGDRQQPMKDFEDWDVHQGESR